MNEGLIKLGHGEVNKLAKDFKVSLPTVRKALQGKSGTSVAMMLRKAALERGGILYQNPVQNACGCEIAIQESESKIIQNFSGVVSLVIDLASGDIEFINSGKVESLYHNLTTEEFARLQLKAQNLATQKRLR